VTGKAETFTGEPADELARRDKLEAGFVVLSFAKTIQEHAQKYAQKQ
jgi:hypothetical protein